MRGGIGVTLICVACATASYEDQTGFPDARPGGGAEDDPMPATDRPDARPGGTGADASPGSAAGCGGVETIGDLPLQQAFIQDQPGAPVGSGIRFRFLNSRLDASATYDVLDVELWDGFGVFGGGPAHVGTFPIDGDETDPVDCGVCVYLFADIDPTTSQAAQVYMAQSGTVTVTSIDGNLTGMLSGILLERIDEDGDPIGDCQSVVPSAGFDAPIVPR